MTAGKGILTQMQNVLAIRIIRERNLVQKNLREAILAYLAAHNTLILATISSANEPHAAALFYVNLEYDLYFLSEPRTRHCVNLAENPRASAVVTEDYGQWQEIKGLQLEGYGSLVTAKGEKIRVMKAYLQKFASLTEFFKSPGLRSQALKAELYKFCPKKIRFVDNCHGFSHKAELVL